MNTTRARVELEPAERMVTDAYASPSPVAKVLLDAAALLRQRGWCQRYATTGDGRICLLAAIGRCAPDPEMQEQAADRLARALPGHTRWHLLSWNDAPDRTVEEVLSVLEEAARG